MIHLKKTIIAPVNEDVLSIEHLEGAEIGLADLQKGFLALQQYFPNHRCLLLDHKHSYSLSGPAQQFVTTMTYFYAIASLVYSEQKLLIMQKYYLDYNFKVPTGAFTSKQKAIEFLLRQKATACRNHKESDNLNVR